MKKFISRLLWRLQVVTVTELFEFYLLFFIVDTIMRTLQVYLKYHFYINNIFINILLTLCVYYILYKFIIR